MRLRFTVRSLIVLTLVCGVVAFGVRVSAPATWVVGTAEIHLEFRVESARRVPIAGAEVGICDSNPFSSALGRIDRTSGRGIALVRLPIDYKGRRTRFDEDVWLDFRGRWLEVSAPGHATYLAALSAVTGARRKLSDSKLPTIVIRLDTGPTPDRVGEFAGDYSDNRRTVSIKPDGRYTVLNMEEHGSELEVGLARAEGGRLVATPCDREDDPPDTFGRYPFLPPKSYRVPCGERIYLIGEGEMLRFCNGVNQFGMANLQAHDSNFLLRDGGREKPTAPVPELPDAWKPYLLKSPVHGRVLRTFFGGGGSVNLGSRDGLHVGMRLYLAESPFATLDVTEVSPSSCVVREFVDNYPRRTLRPGLAVTSRPGFKPKPPALPLSIFNKRTGTNSP